MREQSKMTAGCYCRLSDDDAQDGMSISIETQMKILGDYCRENGINVYSYYRDDGFTGTNFNRPSFKRMMQDAENGLINCIVVKDLSRFGRNYLQVGNYLGDILPAMNVRFIAIGDNVDSASGNLDYDLMVPIKNIFKNTHHSGGGNHRTTPTNRYTTVTSCRFPSSVRIFSPTSIRSTNSSSKSRSIVSTARYFRMTVTHF